MHEFGLYDVDGNRVNGNLARCRTYSAIRRGEAAVQRQMTVYYGEGQSSRELDNLFDDSSTTTYWYFLDLTPGAKYPAKEVRSMRGAMWWPSPGRWRAASMA